MYLLLLLLKRLDEGMRKQYQNVSPELSEISGVSKRSFRYCDAVRLQWADVKPYEREARQL